ncbi:hypothetical protein [uncultured Paraglaciecola sp.]|uniref:hypothetical protein n=1 Tax=uncultured Paraglaciecola sp. TaxID=1765024 RepID=UPI00261BF278|nr:hypothetical protein [uncultured Paraglaciecola sp.]
MLTDAQLLSSIGAALIATIGILWKLHLSASKKTESRLEKVEQHHAECMAETKKLIGINGELIGGRKAVESLHEDVLEMVRKSSDDIRKNSDSR